ncbi:hypothetical protein HUG15_22170 [Salicibibacter cibarius]|uniref:AlpA family phage regulatory protein n=2 Tax=Salicibibacter TaxID=2685905 RepID=A0A7T6Z725_9BACI|nr:MULTISPECIES: hypothetical protein [Salicibibacter]QQK78023.1 hypothetical protein HUG15_22170 [Salicibibacter cibarius]QQK81687.1 hypothetical protein HUG20_18385 [Salicibibacter cibi]
MTSKQPVQYYGLKEFADFAKEEGLEYSTRHLSVYKGRGMLPEPTVLIGDKAGWTREQINEWIKQTTNAKEWGEK